MTQMLKTTFFYNLPTLEGEITNQRMQSILNGAYAREDRIQEERKDREPHLEDILEPRIQPGSALSTDFLISSSKTLPFQLKPILVDFLP